MEIKTLEQLFIKQLEELQSKVKEQEETIRLYDKKLYEMQQFINDIKSKAKAKTYDNHKMIEVETIWEQYDNDIFKRVTSILNLEEKENNK